MTLVVVDKNLSSKGLLGHDKNHVIVMLSEIRRFAEASSQKLSRKVQIFWFRKLHIFSQSRFTKYNKFLQLCQAI